MRGGQAPASDSRTCRDPGKTTSQMLYTKHRPQPNLQSLPPWQAPYTSETCTFAEI